MRLEPQLTNSWHRPPSASAGAGIGWISRATPTPWALGVEYRRCMLGATATTSSTHSTTTSPTTASCKSKLPGMSSNLTMMSNVGSRSSQRAFSLSGPGRSWTRTRCSCGWTSSITSSDTLGRAFLGLTVGCARCHDHKFDPLPQRDYYALAGIFRSTRTLDARMSGVFSDVNRTPLPETPGRAAGARRGVGDLE